MTEHIRIICACGKKLKAPLSYAGKEAKCPGCGKMVYVPHLDVSPAPETPKSKPDPTIPEDRHTSGPEVESPPTTITFPCKRCGTSITVSKKLAGQKTLCPGCHRGVRVPASLSTHIIGGVIVLLLLSCCIWGSLFSGSQEDTPSAREERNGSGSTTRTPFTSAPYEIRVTGTSGMRFSGAYGAIRAGSSDQRSVDGSVPRTYTVTGATIVSACFQKEDEYGVLVVEIWRGGRRIKSGSTSAAYGVVTIATGE